MDGWRAVAQADIESLKEHFVRKYEWEPEVLNNDESLDLYVLLHSARADRRFCLHLRYGPDWEVAGRRESFVNPTDRADSSLGNWPTKDQVRAVKATHNPPCICLRGFHGYHSVLHSDRRRDGETLLDALLELQIAMNR